MKVRELIAILESVNPESLVVSSMDAEGNGYSVICETSFDYYFLPDCPGCMRGEICEKEDLDEMGVTDIPCVVLWPV